MTDEDLALLRNKVRKEPVKLCFTDGEEAIVKVMGISDIHKDIVYDVISSNREDPIHKKGSIVARFDDIKSVSEAA